jgi:DinB superfamily
VIKRLRSRHSGRADRRSEARSSNERPATILAVIVSERAAQLVEELLAASNALIGLADGISAERWVEVATPGEWSPGKDAEHVADGNALHQWLVRSALGLRAGKRPAIERAQLQSRLSQIEVIDLLTQRAQESRRLIEPLTDEQLALPCRTRTVEGFVERGLIGHFRTHQGEIERKLRRAK